MEVAIKYSLEGEEGKKEPEAEAKVKINEESLSVKPQSGVPILCSYRDIADISFENSALQLLSQPATFLNYPNSVISTKIF